MQYTVYLIPLIISILASAIVINLLLKRKMTLGSKFLTLFMFSILIWSTADFFNLLSTTLSAKLFWDNVSYFGVAPFSIFLILFVLEYIGKGEFVNRFTIALLSIIPSITIILVWTNEYHHLIKQSIFIENISGVLALGKIYGTWFWIQFIYIYCLVLLSAVLIFYALGVGQNIYRKQTMIFFLGIFIPWIANFFYVSRIVIFPIDMTSISFAITGIVLFWGITREMLLDIVPTAYLAVFHEIPDSVIVLGGINQILELNHSAEDIFNVKISNIRGKKFQDIVTKWKELSDAFNAHVFDDDYQGVIFQEDKFYEITLKKIFDKKNHFMGQLIVLHDITDRKTAEDALKQSEERFRSYVENAPEGIFISDGKGNYVDVNDAACKLTGYTREELLKMNLIDLIPLESRENAAKSFASVVEQSKGSVEISFIKKGGEKRHWIVNAVKLSEDRILGFTKDITERKKVEEKLKKSEEKYRELVENANSIIAKFDKDGRITSMNEYGVKFFGYAKDELIGRSWNETILPKVESTGRVLENLASDIAKNIDEYGININENIKKNGERVWINWTNKPVYDSNGDVIAILCIGNDITEKKKVEETLEKMRGILLETGRMAKIGGWEADPETMKQIWTQEVYDIHELPYEFQPTVNNGIDFYSPTSRPVLKKAVNDAIAEGTSFDLNLELITAKGNHIWVQAIGKAHIQNGKVIKVSGTIQDITERIKIEKQLMESEEKYRELANSLPRNCF